jgi:hypothetical protein
VRICSYLVVAVKPAYVCDVISVVTEFMVDVVRVEASIRVLQWHHFRLFRSFLLAIYVSLCC